MLLSGLWAQHTLKLWVLLLEVLPCCLRLPRSRLVSRVGGVRGRVEVSTQRELWSALLSVL